MFTKKALLSPTVESLRTGQRDIIAYTNEICDRIDAIDAHIEAMIPEPDRRGRLLKEAVALQAHFPEPGNRPPLYGAPAAIKDIFHVSGFVTRAGSKVPPEPFAGLEAICVRMLRDAGALILGKSVTTEFAYNEPGPTRNPHNTSHTPGGSSSGSAAAVAAGFALLALGTQTVGSVIRPAAFCGIIGFKPTLNRIPSTGLIYYSRTVDHVGLFTQDVPGMRLAASVLCQAWRPVPEPDSMPVLGVPIGQYLKQVDPEGLRAFEEHLTLLEGTGCRIKRIPLFSDIAELNRIHRKMISAEFAEEHRKIYSDHAGLYRPRTAELVETGMKVSNEELNKARRHCAKLRAELEQQMAREGIDLWICPPATGPAPQGIDSTGDPIMNLPWTHAGMPVVTLPIGNAENDLPLGVQLAAPFGTDEHLLAWSQALVDKMD